VRGLGRGKTWCAAGDRALAHLWAKVWHKLEDMSLVPGDNLTITKVKAHRTVADKLALEAAASKSLHLPGTAEARAALQRTYFNELADKWAKKGAATAGPPAHKVQQVKKLAEECKAVLEYIAHFRVELGSTKTTTWEPAKGRGARIAQQQARATRAQTMLERRQARGKQHRLEQIGSCSTCQRCNRRAFTAKGLQHLQLLPCDGKVLRLRQKRADRDLRQQGRRLRDDLQKLAAGEVDVSTLGTVPEAGQLQHQMAQIGPISFCLACSCYAENVSRGLLDACLGKPVSNSEMDKSRRHRRKWLLEGRHPLTGQPLTGAEPGQLAKLERWREQEEQLDDDNQVPFVRPGTEASSSVDLRARPSVCGADKADAGGDRWRADGVQHDTAVVLYPRCSSMRLAELRSARMELSPKVDLAAEEEEEEEDALATSTLAVAATTPSSGAPRNKRCSSSSSSSSHGRGSSINAKWGGHHSKNATLARPSWPIGSIEAAEAELEEERTAVPHRMHRGGRQHARAHSLPGVPIATAEVAQTPEAETGEAATDAAQELALGTAQLAWADSELKQRMRQWRIGSIEAAEAECDWHKQQARTAQQGSSSS